MPEALFLALDGQEAVSNLIVDWEALGELFLISGP